MRIPITTCVTALVGLVLATAYNPASAGMADQDALSAATHDLCPREIAMLGESATHGDGQTEIFKVALVQRLVTECGYDSVFFEANQDEFINIGRHLRTGQPVSTDEISAAVGGLWKFDREFQPLVPFLLAKAQSGQISLGGIDDQLGQLGQDFANHEMITELTGLLPDQRKQDCTLALHRRVYSDYSQNAPYSKADQSQIATCISEIHLAISTDKASDLLIKEEREEMISATQHWISRDFASREEQIVARDKSMFQSFEWLRRQQPKRHKVILWAATVHISKQADPTWLDRTAANFGSYVHLQYDGQAFSLGFSALGGSYRQGRSDIHALSVAPPDSIESQVFRETKAGVAYMGPVQIAAMGEVPGAAFNHVYQTLPWAKFLDGVVVFREETPPTSTR